MEVRAQGTSSELVCTACAQRVSTVSTIRGDLSIALLCMEQIL